jgi:hypothetical protein
MSRLSTVSRIEDQELSAKGLGISIPSLQEGIEEFFEAFSFFRFKRNSKGKRRIYEGESNIIRNVATCCAVGYTAGWT